MEMLLLAPLLAVPTRTMETACVAHHRPLGRPEFTKGGPRSSSHVLCLPTSSSSSLLRSGRCRAQSGGQPGGRNAGRVVVTREHGKNGKLMKALESRGIGCVELPLIEHREGPDLPKLVQTLRDGHLSLSSNEEFWQLVTQACGRWIHPICVVKVEFEWIIVTSPEAATVFLQGWKEAGFPKVRIAVVGVGTGELFDNLKEGSGQLDVAFTPSKATAKVLAAELPKLNENDSRILYPASLKASNDLETGLTERGFHVTRMNTYSTETVRGLDESTISEAAASPVATFASPTAVKAWMELVAGARKWEGAAACIGSTSATAAQKAGLTRIFYPESPGIEGWVESIMEALESQSQDAGIVE